MLLLERHNALICCIHVNMADFLQLIVAKYFLFRLREIIDKIMLFHSYACRIYPNVL